ncbi:hypothetical protein STAL104432_14240 [Streptomyces albus]
MRHRRRTCAAVISRPPGRRSAGLLRSAGPREAPVTDLCAPADGLPSRPFRTSRAHAGVGVLGALTPGTGRHGRPDVAERRTSSSGRRTSDIGKGVGRRRTTAHSAGPAPRRDTFRRMRQPGRRRPTDAASGGAAESLASGPRRPTAARTPVAGPDLAAGTPPTKRGIANAHARCEARMSMDGPAARTGRCPTRQRARSRCRARQRERRRYRRGPPGRRRRGEEVSPGRSRRWVRAAARGRRPSADRAAHPCPAPPRVPRCGAPRRRPHGSGAPPWRGLRRAGDAGLRK